MNIDYAIETLEIQLKADVRHIWNERHDTPRWILDEYIVMAKELKRGIQILKAGNKSKS